MQRNRKQPDDGPPQPPDVERKVALYRHQKIGMTLLALLPILAFAGAFGESRKTSQAAGGSLDVTVTYPTRLRYSLDERIEVRVMNVGGTVLNRVRVSFDPDYMDGFTSMTAVPGFTRAYEIPLDSMAPGETRIVRVDVTARRYWKRSGIMSVSGGTTPLRLNLTTLILP